MITLSKLEKHLDEFKSYLQGIGFSGETIRCYLVDIKNYLQNNLYADKYSYQDILEYQGKQAKLDIGKGVKQNRLTRIKKYYDFLMDTGKREDHPCRSIKLKVKADRTVIFSDLFSMDELEPLVHFKTRTKRLQTCYQTMMSLLIYQAMTSQEVCRLKVSDIDLDKETVHIRGGRRLASRTLELERKQHEILSRYINEDRKKAFNPKSDHLLFSLRSTPLQTDSIIRHIQTFQFRYPGKELCPQTIRKSVISHWLNVKKFPLEQVQLFSGQRNISQTERLRQDDLQEAMEILKACHPFG